MLLLLFMHCREPVFFFFFFYTVPLAPKRQEARERGRGGETKRKAIKQESTPGSLTRKNSPDGEGWAGQYCDLSKAVIGSGKNKAEVCSHKRR